MAQSFPRPREGGEEAPASRSDPRDRECPVVPAPPAPGERRAHRAVWAHPAPPEQADDDLPSLVAGIGRPDFAETLHRCAERVFAADHLVVFLFDRAGGASTYTTVGKIQDRASLRLARKYTRENWYAHDPMLDVIKSAGPHPLVVGGTPRNAPYADRYRCLFFDEVGIVDKVSILNRVRSGTVAYINLHRVLPSRPYDAGARARLLEHGPLLAAALGRHLELALDDRALDARGAAFSRLTEREREVCANILAGRTSEATALALGVSVNTVTTLRRRAYARLGISSQNELLRLAVASR